ncbi:Peptidase family M23 [Corynebacterium mustelae]|uniref:Peptidase family M23 n=1 Tax=Corynebacterium mustelae TaxID=571915 RepID=A0A0G3GYK1_9CORY|nr:M23 family metallopeptidase [Corynebacterium mustelae]AKK06226.1 Peptidase family M23 [Corynebacterium mustelae]
MATHVSTGAAFRRLIQLLFPFLVIGSAWHFVELPPAHAQSQNLRTQHFHTQPTTDRFFLNPVTGTDQSPRVLRGFDKPEHNWLPGHRGVDLEARVGQPIYAAGAGTVLYAGVIAGRPTVSIEHDGGLRTTYQPVFPLVAVGDKLQRGQHIGNLAPNTGSEPGLHWGAKYGQHDYINPLSLLSAPIIRLKPVDVPF